MEGIKPRGRPKTKNRSDCNNPSNSPTETESDSFFLKVSHPNINTSGLIFIFQQEIAEDVDNGIESDDDITLDQLQKQLHQTSKPKTTQNSSNSDQQKKSPQKMRKKEPRKGLKYVYVL